MRERKTPLPRSTMPPHLECFYRHEIGGCLFDPIAVPWPSEGETLVEFCEAVLRRAPEHAEALTALSEVHVRRGDFAKGLEAGLHLSRLRPNSKGVHYSLACSFALTGQRDAALKALTRAVALGYRDVERLQQDRGLASLKDDPRFQELLRQLSEPVPGARKD